MILPTLPPGSVIHLLLHEEVVELHIPKAPTPRLFIEAMSDTGAREWARAKLQLPTMGEDCRAMVDPMGQASPDVLSHALQRHLGVPTLIAVKEAHRLGIPVIAVVDSNCDPDFVDHVIPGNDDSMRAIQLYCSRVASAWRTSKYSTHARSTLSARLPCTRAAPRPHTGTKTTRVR